VSRPIGPNRARRPFDASVRRHEWHVDFSKSFEHIEFDLLSRLCQAVVVFRSSFRHAWLEAVGAIGDAVLGDGPQHLLIQGFQVLDSAVCLLADHRLKGRQHLDRRLETDGSRLDSVLAGRLSHDRTDQVVSQDVRPDLLADKLWCLAAQQIHLHRDLDRPQIEFLVPASAIGKSEIVLGVLVGVQQRRDDDEATNAKARSLDADAALSDQEELRECFVRLPVNRTRFPRFHPFDNVIIFAETHSTAKIGRAV